MLAALEVGQLLGIVALNPARLIDRDRLPAALCAILVLQAVLNNLKLKLSNRTDNLAAIQARGEELRHTLIHQLVNTLSQLLELHRVGILNIAEQLGRERGNTRKLELLTLGEGIANLERSRIVQTHNIARVGKVDNRLLLGHKRRG